MFAGLSDDRLYRFIPDLAPTSLEALQLRYARLQSALSPDGKERWLNWIVFQRNSDDAVGYVQATVRKEEPSDIAFVIFHRYWRSGCAAEATTAAIDHVFRHYDTPALVARVDTRNVASNGLVSKLGFRLVRTIADADQFKGASSDENIHELTRQHWLQATGSDPDATTA